jgi:fumarylacetoacetate (FAA) hydrolase
MKLATYQDGSRDGQLVVVSRDLRTAHFASGIATRLQQVLDDWGFLSPQLEDLSRQLNQGRARHAFAFDPAQCLAPLPRSGQWVRTRAYRAQLAQVWPERDTRPTRPWACPGWSRAAATASPAPWPSCRWPPSTTRWTSAPSGR